MIAQHMQYQVGVDIDVSVRPIAPQSPGCGPQSRLLGALIREPSVFDAWLKAEVVAELGGGALEQLTYDHVSHVVLSKALPLLAESDRAYFEYFLARDLFFDVTDVVQGTCRCKARRAVLECVLHQDARESGLPQRRRYRAVVEVGAEIENLDAEFGKGAHARITSTFADCAMTFEEYMHRQRQLMNAVVSHAELLEAWMRFNAVFEVLCDGAGGLWPPEPDRRVVLAVIDHLSSEDRAYFADVRASLLHDGSLYELDGAVSVRGISVDIDDAQSVSEAP